MRKKGRTRKLGLSKDTLRQLEQASVGARVEYSATPSVTDCSDCPTCTGRPDGTLNCPTVNCAPWSHTCATWHC